MTSEEGSLEALSRSSAFRNLDANDQQRLALALEYEYLPGGSTLMAEGDQGDSMYLVHTGRLRVLVHRDGLDVPVGEIGPGEVVGEMSLLSDRSRSATVVAIRDTSLWKLSKEAFNGLVVTHPALLLEMTRLLVVRLHRTNRAATVESDITSLVLLPVDRSLDIDRFAAAFMDTLGDGVVKLDSAMAPTSTVAGMSDLSGTTPTEMQVSRWMYQAEAAHDLVVYQADLELTPWTRRCLRQADLVLLVTTSDARGEPTEAETRVLWESESRLRPQVDLVVVHARGTTSPTGTSRLLSRRDVQRHHHVESGSWKGLSRLDRVVRSSAVALVLGGGGARGFAHLGVIKALQERGIPIDFVGGTSIGASAAAGVALGWDTATSIANAKHVTVDRGSLIDFTPPAVALSTGETMVTGLRDVFGDTQIEDLWVPMFCVSTDLTEGSARIHTRGSVWRSVRSSIAIPGTFPPMRADDGHLLVDGGVVNNLPVDVMVQFAKGSTILAVDLRARAQLPTAGLPSDGVVSGWGIIGSHLNPGSNSAKMPRIIDILLRSNEVASSPHGDDADLVFHPSVDAFGVLDFSSWEELVEVGYGHANETLDAWPDASSLEEGRYGQARRF
jgi:predicted acylesterase/phospholipase RssA/CRP-like cAMP-binding protein